MRRDTANKTVEHYTGFNTLNDLITDHKQLKEQIKTRADKLNALIDKLADPDVQVILQNDAYDEDITYEIIPELSEIYHECFTINN